MDFKISQLDQYIWLVTLCTYVHDELKLNQFILPFALHSFIVISYCLFINFLISLVMSHFNVSTFEGERSSFTILQRFSAVWILTRRANMLMFMSE